MDNKCYTKINNIIVKYYYKILLSKLYAYAVRGLLLHWFESYLNNRSQYVKIGDTESRKLHLLCGVPQGSTLGPLLFLLYINDLPNCCDKLCFRIFADDTNIFFASKNLRELESAMNVGLKSVLTYCNINKLSLNLQKTTYTLITSPQKRVNININNIERKSYIKYLGVFIDEHLRWGPQIQHVKTDSAQRSSNKCKKYLPKNYS